MLGAVVVAGYLYWRLDDEIRRQVEKRLADYYHDYDVQVGSARFDAEHGIAVGNLELWQKAADGTSQLVLSIEEMYLAGNVRMDQLVTGQMPIDEVSIRRAKLRMAHRPDGQWNSHALLPPPHFGNRSPTVKIEDASATIENPSAGSSKPWVISGLNLTLTSAQAVAANDGSDKRCHIEGTANGLPAQEIRINGEIGTGNGAFDLTISAVGLDISPEMLASLPGSPAARMHGVEFSGRSNLNLRVSRADASAEMNWSASMKLDRGQIAYPSLPEPLTDVKLEGHADHNRLVIEKLSGKCGLASVVLAVDRAGWGENAPLGLALKVSGLTIDERMGTGLPEPYSRIWERFRPIGSVDAKVDVTFDGEKWRPVVIAQCKGMSITDMEKFPYTLEQTTGRVEYHPAEKGSADRLKLDLTGFGAGRPIKVEAELRQLSHPDPEGAATTATGVAAAGLPAKADAHAAGYRGVGLMRPREHAASHPVGFVKVYGTDIPLHEKLLAALPKEKAQPLVRSLAAEGTIDFAFRCEWKDPSQEKGEVTHDIRLKDCRIQYANFRYPLQHLRGLVTAQNEIWKLQDIGGVGASDATTVKGSGEATPATDGYDVRLNIVANNVPLDDTLKNALCPAAQQAWTDLQPQGRIDFNAQATKLADKVEPAIAVNIRPREKSVSIEPRLFPYRLERIDGQAAYQHGRVDLQKIVAEHDRTQYSAESGVWQVQPDGGWQLSLSKVSADRLAVTRDLLVAMPPSLQTSVERFQPTGTFSLYNSTMSLARSPQFAGAMTAWDVNLECQQAAIQGPLPLRGVTGGVHLVGRSDGQSVVAAGEMAFDSLILKDVQLTNVHGPLWADGAHLLIGEPACRQQNQPARRVTADAYGGSLAANIELTHDANPSYNMDVRLGGVSLARFANERLGGAHDMTGTVSGSLAIAGTGQTTQTLRGRGEMHVVDGSIYQLPPLVSMLKVLRNRTPDTTAFNRCDMQFEIQGEHVHFQHLDLLGDAVSLYGNGEVDFDRRLDLTFYTLIGLADLQTGIFKTIAGHLSQQSWQLKVVGTFDHPETERKALPAMTNMLDHIQGELQDGAATMSPTTATRGPRVPPR